MKEVDFLIKENEYLEEVNMKLLTDHEKMKLFLEDLKHPEGYGYAVTTEVRQEAGRILRGLLYETT